MWLGYMQLVINCSTAAYDLKLDALASLAAPMIGAQSQCWFVLTLELLVCAMTPLTVGDGPRHQSHKPCS
jgi:hypothetical protein